MISMIPSARLFLALGSLGMFLAVAAGAFGAHAFKKMLDPELLAVYQTAVHYHVYHALGLLVVGLLALHVPLTAPLRWAGWLLVVGLVLFSGSLYMLSLTGMRGLGIITPFGGAAFLAAWLLLGIAVLRS